MSIGTPEPDVNEVISNLKSHFRNPMEPDRVFAKGKKVELVYVVVSKGVPLFRTEGPDDVTLFEIRTKTGKVDVPAILPEKIAAKLRRNMLELLRAHPPSEDVLKKYAELGFLKILVEESGGARKLKWNCYVAPPIKEEHEGVGMCGFCPACNILGTVITDRELKGAKTSYGLKSRVAFDVAFATAPYEESVVTLTHNKVGDGVSYTGTALWEESHVVPGVVFVGKVVLSDVTELEFKLVLKALESITRLGGSETKYGSVQVIPLAVKAGSEETVSSYDIARYVLENYKAAPPEDVVRCIANYLQEKGFSLLVKVDAKLEDMKTGLKITTKELEELWANDNYEFSKSVVEQIKRVEGREPPTTLGGERKEKGKRGRGKKEAEGEE
ncbi:MAG: type I-D CRISPR-associated protein Cas7/Csc2 [Desulfurococcaceae archaeon]